MATTAKVVAAYACRVEWVGIFYVRAVEPLFVALAAVLGLPSALRFDFIVVPITALGTNLTDEPEQTECSKQRSVTFGSALNVPFALALAS